MNESEKLKKHGNNKIELFLKQKQMLDLFLEKNAISKQQYENSLHDLAEKMGYSIEYKKTT